ncbi:putative Palmitoyltransferase SWF1 [Glarea lozoyensis 74030]|uniref:Palmitoyltransferase n=1 Tax=Glarea lozoyensis (strain ATCC 74030 / MF5533) TaxID=1104152 RepID=H0EW62_GLAL7|nr:putative Palmitoyltransferase SWF1 [Glarea lozoyensis 74030]
MIFFILLLLVSEVLFLPPAWTFMSNQRKITATTLLSLPYIFLYKSVYTDPGYITSTNHTHALTLYPYDFTLFHPGQNCRTCHLLKPARSKHCYNNQHFFILLLLTTATLISYASYIGFSILSAEILRNLSSWTPTGKGYTWGEYINIWAWAMQEYTRIGAVTLLCLLTAPLVWGLLGYHLYLIWAGTTTNESMKWSDWTVEMHDGLAFKRPISPSRIKNEEYESSFTTWPVESQQVLVRTSNGKPPKMDFEIGEGEWVRVWGLKDVENLYDLGLWDNLRDVFLKRRAVA